MIMFAKTLNIKNFSVLPNGGFEFSPHLNIIVAENACGKSHLLKLIYTLLKITSEPEQFSKNKLQEIYARKFINVFRPDELGRLVKRKQGRERAEIKFYLDSGLHSELNFASNAKTQVNVEYISEQRNLPPVFIPTRELITLEDSFTTQYIQRELSFEETWFDTVLLLKASPLKGPRLKEIDKLLAPIEEVMGDKVNSRNGRFYLGNVEAPLVAEGMRKLMMIARLLATGSLQDKGYLFWDEPEANLNPKLIKAAAKIIFSLASTGIQVFIATHSLFLLRELEILNIENKISKRFFSLTLDDKGTQLQQGDNMSDLDTIVALDESLMQSERYLDATITT